VNKSFARSLAFDAANVALIVVAVGGAQWALNILMFWVFGLGSLAILVGAGVMAMSDERARGEETRHLRFSEARVQWELFSGVALSVTYAALGWFGMCAVQFVATLTFAGGLHRVRAANA
jgi:4-hydroxybenzoate polyprenyltransferase